MESLDLVDTHAHLDIHPLSKDPGGAVQRAHSQGVSQIITIGIDPKSSAAAVALAGSLDSVYATVGIHPHDAQEASRENLDELISLSTDPKVVAWGEIGLDFVKNYCPKDTQFQAFQTQLDIASSLSLPIVIHDREAHSEVLELLEGSRNGLKGVIHCFSGDVAFARRILDMGLHISVTGIVTFPRAEVLRQVVSYVPLDRLLLETDAPFLSPVPFRGRPNEPARVYHVAVEVARIKKRSLEEIAQCTSANARALFALPTP